MIRYYASTILIGTAEGNLPKELFTAHDYGIEGIELRADPLRRSRIKAPFWSFMDQAEQSYPLLDECSLAAHTEWLRLWDKAVKAAETPPTNIAKPGEVWDYTGVSKTMPRGFYYVADYCASTLSFSLLCINTGDRVLASAGTQVGNGIQFDHPDDWTCHGRLTDLIRGKV